ncbi:hypothetical protein [Pontibacter rugosus]|uniref:SpoIIAA-like protein n=1 Tax=Pontibacter rugosus TaxID=1745966 RepID=A0ABW3SX84_9BACT
MKYVSKDGLLELKYNQVCPSEELKAELLTALMYAYDKSIKHWLLDLTQTNALEDSEEAWLYGFLVPEMMMRLGSDNYLAIVLSESCFTDLLHRLGESGLRSYNSFVSINFFCEYRLAHAWLRDRLLLNAS